MTDNLQSWKFLPANFPEFDEILQSGMKKLENGHELLLEYSDRETEYCKSTEGKYFYQPNFRQNYLGT